MNPKKGLIVTIQFFALNANLLLPFFLLILSFLSFTKIRILITGSRHIALFFFVDTGSLLPKNKTKINLITKNEM
jgi:hypothetical protein